MNRISISNLTGALSQNDLSAMHGGLGKTPDFTGLLKHHNRDEYMGTGSGDFGLVSGNYRNEEQED
jgi:hypothetical protein